MQWCSNCQVELKHVFEHLPNQHRRKDDYPQYDDALIIELSGGYGMFIDPMMHRIEKFILCKNCAELFLVQNNWIDKEMLT